MRLERFGEVGVKRKSGTFDDSIILRMSFYCACLIISAVVWFCSLRNRYAGALSSNSAPVRIKTPFVRKAIENHLLEFNFLEENLEP